jgi:hypothetical protein
MVSATAEAIIQREDLQKMHSLKVATAALGMLLFASAAIATDAAHAKPAQTQAAPAYIVAYSRATAPEACKAARQLIEAGFYPDKVSVRVADNGYFAVVVGPVEEERAEYELAVLRTIGAVPDDSFITHKAANWHQITPDLVTS